MRTGAFVLVGLLGLGGCSPEPMTEIAVSPGFSEVEREIIEQEAERWFERVPEMRVPVFVGQGDSGAVIIGSPLYLKEPCGQRFGMTALKPGKAPVVGICVREDGNGDFRRTVRHELGHALGRSLDHLPDGNTMAEFPSGMSEDITERDARYARDGE